MQDYIQVLRASVCVTYSKLCKNLDSLQLTCIQLNSSVHHLTI